MIIGAGLAGMTAGVRLSEAGFRVQMLESNPFIGGRTSSWNDNGMHIESGLHRFLGVYTALPEVLKKGGVNLDNILYWEDEIEIRTPDGGSAVMGLAPLHKPFKTLGAMLGNNDFLPPEDKLALGRMFAAAAKDYVANPEALDQITVLAYAKKHGVSERAIKRALIPLTEGIFFLPIQMYSMFNLAGLFMPYVKTLPKLRVGAFKGGMTEVMMEPMAEYIRARGGEIHTSTPVERLLVRNAAVHGVVAKGQQIPANHVVLAVSLFAAQQILQKEFAGHSSLQNLFRLPIMPAVTIQLELSKPSLKIDRTTFGPGTALASFAEQSRSTFQNAKGRLSIILSHPETYIDMPADKIVKIVLADAKRLGIELHDSLLDYRKVRLANDFYSLAPGSEALRPHQKTDIPGLVLAGDYTKQPYLATMEGAVVSGNLAAEIIQKS